MTPFWHFDSHLNQQHTLFSIRILSICFPSFYLSISHSILCNLNPLLLEEISLFSFTEMGCGRNFFCSHKLRHLTISFLFLMISSWSQLRFITEARTIPRQASHYQEEEEKAILRGQIGSRPPRCERRCSSCGHCEAIQVPTDPQIKNSSSSISRIDFARGDGSSNYKPMSWKCKCGNSIFNP